jgi:hypothetical protein
MPIDASWETGPRNEAWDELWRRLLASVFKDDGPEGEEPRCTAEDDDPNANGS